MKLFMGAIVLGGCLHVASPASGRYYLGASQNNVEGGYSSEKWNYGLGIRAFAYDINRPSRLASNGDMEVTGYYLQKRFGMAKLQFGHAYRGSFIYDNQGERLDYGSGIGIVKIGMEAGITDSFGAYWDCIPVYIGNFNLFELDSRDFNRIEIGNSSQKIGIRLYL